MNVNPISFKGVTKIIGSSATASANRISDIINNGEKGDTKAEQKLASRFNPQETQGQATSVSFDNGKSAYVVTGDDFTYLKDLQDDMISQVEIASQNYGKNSQMMQMVKEAEVERYTDLATVMLINRKDTTLRTGFDEESGKIKSIDLIL